MGEWFTDLTGPAFDPLGTSHLIVLAVYAAGIILLILTNKKITGSRPIYQIVRWGLFGLLVISEISYQVWTGVNGIWSLAEHVPLHLCGIASITGAIALVTGHKKLIIITFFIGFLPAFLALVTPELPTDYPHFRFWKFFLHHMAISWVGVFLLVTSNVRVTFKSFLETYSYLLLYAALIGFIINPWLESNYLYLSATPTASTPLDLFGDGAGYYINLCLAAFLSFFILYVIVRITRKSAQ